MTTTSGNLPLADVYQINDDLIIGIEDGCRSIFNPNIGKVVFKNRSGFYCVHPKCPKAIKVFEDAYKFRQYAKLAANNPLVMQSLVETVTGISYQEYIDNHK